MREFIDVTGKTEDEAISKALEQLGLDRDDVSVEILERAKSGFLGLGSCPAKVRVSYGEEEEPVLPVTAPVTPEKKPEQPKKPAAEKQPAPEKKPERKSRSEKTEKEEKAPTPKPAPVQDLGEEVDDEKSQAIRKFLTGLLAQMENEATVKVYQPEKGRYKVILEGENLGALIGRRGETLDAVQYLTSLKVNRGQEGYTRVTIDTENYRAKREDTLVRLANRMANRAVKTGRKVSMEPMNPYERRIIHSALQANEAVDTHSEGEEPNRHVVITLRK